MAKDIITRFKLETTGFDSKIKEAAKNLSAYSKTATQAKEGFNQFTKANVDEARALGTMATSTTNVKDRVKELVGAYNDAAKAYEALTKEQQQSDWAKALAGSLTQLQQRIREAKTEMQGLNTETKGGIFSGLSGKMEGALAVFGGNLMTKAAGAVANLGSEMYGMVQQGIELARQGEGIRVAFERLGNGQILQGLREATHGTVTDIELMKAAVKFNDFKLPVEELGTMLAFAQQKAKDTGQSVDYMVDSIVTGLGRKSLMILDNLGLSATEVKDKMKETGDMTKAVGAIIREQMAKAGDYVETAADRAAQANVNLQNKMEELGRKFAPLEEASNSLWTSMKIGILDIIGGPLATLLNQLTQAGRMANAYGLMGGNAKVGRMTANLAGASEGKRQSIYQQQQEQFWRYINPREQQIRDIRAWQSGDRNEALQKRIGAITEKYGSLDATKIQAEVDAAKKMLSDYQAAAKQILQPIEQKIVPTFGDGGSGGGGKSGSKTIQTELQQNQAKINTLTQEFVKLGDSETEASRQRQAEIQKEIALLQQRNGLLGLRAEQAQGRMTLRPSDMMLPTATSSALLGNTLPTIPSRGLVLSDNAKKAVTKNIFDNMQKDDDKDSTIDKSKKMLNAISQLTSGLQQIGIELPSQIQGVISVVQGVMQVIDAVNTIIGVTQTTALTANTAAMISLEAALWANTATSLIPFSNGGAVRAAGGVVTGNTYSGDQIPALLNAGEVVLNRAQTAHLANELQSNTPGGNIRLSGRLAGHDIVMAVDRTLSQEGRGQLLTFK